MSTVKAAVNALLVPLALSCSGATEDLWDAVLYRDIARAGKALERGANVNDYRRTVMSTTVGRTTTVYTNTLREYTPLMSAAAGGDNAMVSFLLAHGADVRLLDQDGKSALSHAIMSRRPETMKILIRAGADPSLKAEKRLDITPVMDAATADCVECLAILHAAKAPLDGAVASGMSALLLAAEHGSTGALKFLLDRGMDANSSDRFGKTALMYAAYENRLDAVRLLLARGAAVDKCGSDGRTALFGAAALGRTDIVRCLLAHGAKPKVYAPNGQSALGLAKKNGHGEVVDMLLKAGAM